VFWTCLLPLSTATPLAKYLCGILHLLQVNNDAVHWLSPACCLLKLLHTNHSIIYIVVYHQYYSVLITNNSWWWTKNLSETCRVLFQKWIWEIGASSWFYYKNISWCTVTWISKKLYIELLKIRCSKLCATNAITYLLTYLLTYSMVQSPSW